MIRTHKNAIVRLQRLTGVLSLSAFSFLTSESCVHFAEHRPINQPTAGSGITAQIQLDFNSTKKKSIEKIVYSDAKEIKYKKVFSELEGHIEVTKKLADACKKSGFEDVALLTSLGHIYPIAEKKSAYNVYVKGKLVESSVSFNFNMIREIARDERKITLYHCHPQSTSEASEYVAPSIFDMISASLSSVRLYAKYPDMDIRFRIVMEKDDGSISAVEYTPKMDLFDIGMRARQSSLFERFKEAEGYIEKCKKIDEGCTLDGQFDAYEVFRKYVAHTSFIIAANVNALVQVNQNMELVNMPARQDLLMSYKREGKNDDEAKKTLFFHMLNTYSYFDVKDVTEKK